MSQDRYAEVDAQLERLLAPGDDALHGALERAEVAGMPRIAVSPLLGKLLYVLALAGGSRRILELGTLAGYSTIWLARALPPDGSLLTLEYAPEHAEVARRNLEIAGVADRVEVRVGRALDLLAEMDRGVDGPFDLVFIDADKEPYADYLDAAIGLSRPGAMIVADNVVRGGGIADPDDDPRVDGARRFNQALADDPRVEGTVIQTVGVKGHDGIAIAVVR